MLFAGIEMKFKKGVSTRKRRSSSLLKLFDFKKLVSKTTKKDMLRGMLSLYIFINYYFSLPIKSATDLELWYGIIYIM